MKDLILYIGFVLTLITAAVVLAALTRISHRKYIARLHRTRNEIADDRRRGMRRCKDFAAVGWLALVVTAVAGMSHW